MVAVNTIEGPTGYDDDLLQTKKRRKKRFSLLLDSEKKLIEDFSKSFSSRFFPSDDNHKKSKKGTNDDKVRVEADAQRQGKKKKKRQNINVKNDKTKVSARVSAKSPVGHNNDDGKQKKKKKLSKRKAATKIQAMVRGGIVRMDFRLACLKKKLQDIQSGSKESKLQDEAIIIKELIQEHQTRQREQQKLETDISSMWETNRKLAKQQKTSTRCLNSMKKCIKEKKDKREVILAELMLYQEDAKKMAGMFRQVRLRHDEETLQKERYNKCLVSIIQKVKHKMVDASDTNTHDKKFAQGMIYRAVLCCKQVEDKQTELEEKMGSKRIPEKIAFNRDDDDDVSSIGSYDIKEDVDYVGVHDNNNNNTERNDNISRKEDNVANDNITKSDDKNGIEESTLAEMLHTQQPIGDHMHCCNKQEKLQQQVPQDPNKNGGLVSTTSPNYDADYDIVVEKLLLPLGSKINNSKTENQDDTVALSSSSSSRDDD